MGAIFNNGRLSTGGFTSPIPDHSVSFWWRLESLPTGTDRAWGNANLWEWRSSGSSTTMLHELEQSGTNPSFATAIGTLYHLVLTVDTANTTKEIYANGASVAINASATFAGQQTGTLSFGSRATSTQYMNCYLDDFRIYDRVLTPAEIETIFATRGTDAICNGLTNWWKLDEGVEGTNATGFIDIVGGVNLTTLVGSAPVYAYDAGLKHRRRA